MKLILASKNRKKLIEMSQILEGMGIETMLQSDAGIDIEPEETGSSFMENALIKARAVMEAGGSAAIADDSGLVIDALGGEPGIYSARYGGPGYDDIERYKLALKKLENTPDNERTARFICVIACVFPDGETLSAEGTCEGVITREPKGGGGFGYDPVFFLPEYGMTMAELDAGVKNKISHRARALVNFKSKWMERNNDVDK